VAPRGERQDQLIESSGRGVAVDTGAIPTRDATTTPNEMPTTSVRRISEYRIPMRMATR
jgi:hypothetical protein